jgi:hypothetical protein
LESPFSLPGSRRHTPHQKKRFLEHFAEFGNVSTAAKLAGIDRTTVYFWQEIDDEFAEGFRQADLKATEVLEAEARRRAVEGVTSETPVRGRNGELLDTIVETKYSDTLLIFLLKARSPEKYRDRHDITSGGQPIQPAYDLDLVIEQRLAAMAARGQSAPALASPGTTITVDATG